MKPKPKPQAPRKIWVNDYGKVLGHRAYPTRRDAENYADATGEEGVLQIEFIEVLPERKKP